MKENIKKIAKYLGWLFLLVLVCVLIYDFLRRGIFDTKTGMNLLIVGDQGVGLLIIRPEESVVNWVSLPGDLKVKIFNSTATYPIGSLWSFGVTEKRPYEITKSTIGDTLGVVIPRMIKIDGVASVDNLIGKFFSLSLKTDLTIKDRWSIRQVVSDAAVSKKVFELEIPRTAFDKVMEADGKEFLVVNKIIDVWSKDKFYHDDILEEGVEVSINNLSGVDGAGLSLSDQLDSAGFRVVDVVNDKNDDIKAKGCRFLASKEYPLSTIYLENQVGCEPLPKNENKEVNEKLIKIWLK